MAKSNSGIEVEIKGQIFCKLKPFLRLKIMRSFIGYLCTLICFPGVDEDSLGAMAYLFCLLLLRLVRDLASAPSIRYVLLELQRHHPASSNLS